MAIRVAPLDDNLDFPEGVQQRQAERLGDGGTPEGSAVVRAIRPNIVAAGIKRRPRVPTLHFREHTGLVRQPLSVGDDGYIYANRTDGANMPVRSNDGFITTDQGTAKSFSSQGDAKVLRMVYKVAEGWIAITSSSATEDASTVWFTDNWAAPTWRRVLDLGFVMPISIGRPTRKKGGGGTVFLIGEYGNRDTRRLHLSEDGGQTFRVIYTHQRKPNGGGNNTHIHHASYDADTGRIWLSCGDGVNNWFGYSDDMGSTWIDVPAAGAGPEDTGTIYNHPTVLTPTSKMMVSTPDGSRGGIGVWTLNKDTARVTVAHEVAKTEPYRAWARAPWAQNGDELYILFPPDEVAGEIEELIVAGSGDGGDSWYTMARIPINKKVDNFYTGMVGPDKDGKLWIYGKRNGAHTLLVADTPGWEDASRTGVLETERGTGVLARSPLTSIENSATETVLATLNIPGGIATDGDIVRVKAFGTYKNNSGSNADVIFKVRLRNVEVLSTANMTVGTATATRKWSLEMDVFVTGQTYSAIHGKFTMSRASTAPMPTGGELITGNGVNETTEATITKAAIEIRAASVVANPEVTVRTIAASAELIRSI